MENNQRRKSCQQVCSEFLFFTLLVLRKYACLMQPFSNFCFQRLALLYLIYSVNTKSIKKASNFSSYF